MEKFSPEADHTDSAKSTEDREDSTMQPRAPNFSELKPVTREAYGGGMYAAEDKTKMAMERAQPRASTTQSADGLEQRALKPKHKPPPLTGDRELEMWISLATHIYSKDAFWIWNVHGFNFRGF